MLHLPFEEEHSLEHNFSTTWSTTSAVFGALLQQSLEHDFSTHLNTAVSSTSRDRSRTRIDLHYPDITSHNTIQHHTAYLCQLSPFREIPQGDSSTCPVSQTSRDGSRTQLTSLQTPTTTTLSANGPGAAILSGPTSTATQSTQTTPQSYQSDT